MITWSRTQRSPVKDIICWFCGGSYSNYNNAYVFRESDNRELFDWLVRTPAVTQAEIDEILF